MKFDSLMRFPRSITSPKGKLPIECVWYCLFSYAASAAGFLVLQFAGAGPVSSFGLATVIGGLSFWAAFAYNNRVFSRDEKILRRLIILERRDPVELLQQFLADVNVSMNAGDPGGNLDALRNLFSKIYGSRGHQLADLFLEHRNEYLAFLMVLSPVDREILVRHYMIYE